MQISCKCLNFIATSNSQAANSNNVGIISIGSNTSAATTRNPAAADEDSSMPLAQQCNDGSGNNNNANNLCTTLMHAFLQRFPRTFIFYSQCMEFFKQAIGPITDLNIHTLNQRDLVYSITLEVPTGQEQPLTQAWQLSICVNCNTALCAKRLPAPTPAGAPAALTINPPQFLINCSLLTNNEELSLRRADKSFSDTFGLLIMDHPQLQLEQSNIGALSNFSVGSLSTAVPSMQQDIKQQRLRQLQQNLQQRLKREIAETDERIQRYTEQQFALLKSFREKSEQEYALLGRLIQRVPEQQAIEFLDRAPPALEVIGGGGGVGGSYASRRRNTISSRRDIMSVTTPTTPTTPNPTSGVHMLTLPLATTAPSTPSAMDTTNTQGISAGATTHHTPATTLSSTVLATTIVGSNSVNRRVSNFDTPPATPEATPMSVGNSPTFRPQQQQQQHHQQQQQQSSLTQQQFVRIAANSFQQQFPTPTVEVADDCLFELEGIDGGGAPPVNNSSPYSALVSNLSQKLPYHQQQRLLNNHAHPHYHQQHHYHGRDMSDVDESEDDAGEAEVALDLDSTMPISMGSRPIVAGQQRPGAAAIAADVMNFAKSLPIEIANSPMTTGRSYVNALHENELDNTVDIAASIKALAKSVHGEAVFGDLPRPRMRSQI
ncbi:uncharacterized protein LOC101462496 [Ceratitis capitata]|uniref:Uncharacterized protein n=1 Tax=Ceratitis capitata TaxID=7213 RepID=W8BJU8_CERCA|nr:uncharacterized protein LOC101462496 [Ceratitis capitata]